MSQLPEFGRRLARNAATLSAFNAAGVLAALAQDVVMAALFGLGRDTDAFFLAYTVPQFVVLTLAGSVQEALIPIFSGAGRGGEDGEDPWRAIRLVVSTWALILAGVGVIGYVLANPLVRVIGAGAPIAQRAQTVQLARLLFWMIPLLGLSEILRAALISQDRYALASAGNLMRYSVSLAVMVTLGVSLGISAVAWGYLGGALLQLVWMVCAILWIGGSLRPLWAPKDPLLKESLRLMGQRMGGIAIRRTRTILERFLASFLPPGSITALTYAQRVSMSLWQVFANSVSTAILPDLATAAQERRVGQMREMVAKGIRLLSVVVWPVAVGGAVLSLPLIRLLFERRAFHAAASVHTARLLQIYVLSIPALVLVQVLLAPHYARKDARTPMVHMIWMLALNGVLAVALTPLWGTAGLALAYTLASFASLARSYYLAERMMGSFRDVALLSYLGRVGLACSVMAAVTWTVAWRLSSLRLAPGALSLVIELGASSLVGGIVYLAMARWLKLGELRELARLLPGLGRLA
ncbi:MAG TPA: murein biosynthesis integral membrane protein MurJ [Caldilineae bacterium]|nr:murein biosynthesis integral membrane protein MurJ [Caldilineae bacterium]